MSENTHLFTGKVEAYERYRQRYPAGMILELLRGWCGLQPEWIVADVGAGTGMLAEVFLANGNRVLAIEPNAEMRAACEQIHSPLLTVLDATAEATGLEDGSVEMVAAGRAFHWFDTERSLAEFRRVLRPGGWVVLASAGRAAPSTEQVVEFEQLLTEHASSYAQVHKRYRVHDTLKGFFGELHHAEIPGEQSLDWDALQGWTQSISFVPHAGSPRYEPFQENLRKYFGRHSRNGVLTIATTCWVNAGRW